MPKDSARNPIDARAQIQVDGMDAGHWQAICGDFTDANIYQTLPYECVRSGRTNVSHLVLRRHSTVIAAVQARIVRVPYLKAVIPYVRWGPLCQRRGDITDVQVFREAVRALRDEYVGRQGLCLRILPRLSDDGTESFKGVLEEEGYVPRPLENPKRTILMDLRPSLDELHQGLHHKWRYHLGKARKHALELVEGHEDSLFEDFEHIYDEMVDRKKFVSFTDIRQFRMIQRGLMPGEKMWVVLCRVNGEVCSGGICSALGDTGIYLFGATSNRGLKTYGLYLVHWGMLECV